MHFTHTAFAIEYELWALFGQEWRNFLHCSPKFQFDYLILIAKKLYGSDFEIWKCMDSYEGFGQWTDYACYLWMWGDLVIDLCECVFGFFMNMHKQSWSKLWREALTCLSHASTRDLCRAWKHSIRSPPLYASAQIRLIYFVYTNFKVFSFRNQSKWSCCLFCANPERKDLPTSFPSFKMKLGIRRQGKEMKLGNEAKRFF